MSKKSQNMADDNSSPEVPIRKISNSLVNIMSLSELMFSAHESVPCSESFKNVALMIFMEAGKSLCRVDPASAVQMNFANNPD